MSSSISSSDATENSEASYLTVLLGLMAGVSFLFIVASEWLVRTHVAPNQNFEAHAAFLRTSTKGSAAFGDSHVAMGIHGDATIANLGFPADSIWDIVGKARIYFARVKPERVILQADPQQLAPVRLNKLFEPVRGEFEAKSFLSTVLKVSSPVFRRNIVSHWRTYLAGKQFSKIRQFSQLYGSQTADSDIAKWSEAKLLAFAARVLQDQVTIRIEEGHAGLKAMRELITWLVAKGARVCLVTYPVHDSFRMVAEKYPVETQAITFYRRMAEETGARYVNMRNAGYPDSLFFDPDHLNRIGADRFTKLVVQNCFS